MSFFTLSDNTEVTTNGTFTLDEPIKPIPNDTQLNAYIEEAKWDETEQLGSFISLRWSITGGEYDGRKVFQKLKVKSPESNKRDKAIRMLMAIDHNCGGNLVKSGHEPDDMALGMYLVNTPMVIFVKVWAIKDVDTGELKTGNYIASVTGSAAPLSDTPNNLDDFTL